MLVGYFKVYNYKACFSLQPSFSETYTVFLYKVLLRAFLKNVVVMMIDRPRIPIYIGFPAFMTSYNGHDHMFGRVLYQPGIS